MNPRPTGVDDNYGTLSIRGFYPNLDWITGPRPAPLAQRSDDRENVPERLVLPLTANINILRQIGHNLPKNETTLKAGIPGKRHNAGWDEDYPLKALLG